MLSTLAARVFPTPPACCACRYELRSLHVKASLFSKACNIVFINNHEPTQGFEARDRSHSGRICRGSSNLAWSLEGQTCTDKHHRQTFLFLLIAFIATQTANSAEFSASTGPNIQSLLFISLAFGFALAVNAWAFFRVSGGLFNPAVTLSLFLIGAVKPLRYGSCALTLLHC